MKTRLLILLVSFFCCFLVNAQQRIIGGQTIDISQAPYQTCIFVTNAGMKGFGGGFLLNNQWILTAKHVIQGIPVSNVKVSLGNNNPNTDGERKSVSQIVQHPSADIALLKLSSPITFSNKIAPIYISKTRGYSRNTVGTVTGWGQTYEGPTTGMPNTQLLRCTVTIQSISNNEIVAIATGGGPYSGDSGGALVIEHSTYQEAIGVYLGRPGDYQETGERSFANISNYYDWISSYVTLYSISGPTTLCSSGTFNFSAPGCTLSVSPSLDIVSQNSNSVFVEYLSRGSGYISLKAGNRTIYQNAFWVGTPAVLGITYDGYYLHANTYGAGVTKTEWTIGTDLPHVCYGADMVSPYSSGTYIISVTATNSCGTSLPYKTEFTFSRSSRYAISVLARQITVSPIRDDANTGNLQLLEAPASPVMNYALVNLASGIIATNGSMSSEGGTLDFSAVPASLYVLKLFTPDGAEETFKVQLK